MRRAILILVIAGALVLVVGCDRDNTRAQLAGGGLIVAGELLALTVKGANRAQRRRRITRRWQPARRSARRPTQPTYRPLYAYDPAYEFDPAYEDELYYEPVDDYPTRQTRRRSARTTARPAYRSRQ